MATQDLIGWSHSRVDVPSLSPTQQQVNIEGHGVDPHFVGRSTVRGGNVTFLEHQNRIFPSSVRTFPGIARHVAREEEVPACQHCQS